MTERALGAVEPPLTVPHVHTALARPQLIRSEHGISLREVAANDLSSRPDYGSCCDGGPHDELSPPVDAISRFLASWRLPLGTWFKRAFDLAGAMLIGLVFSPLLAVIALLLHLEGGAVIYRHERVGRHGRKFGCLKFRTMVPNAERLLASLLENHPELKAEWLRDHKLRRDPRVTALGAFLRRTSFDELPQIWNVVRGEMSLVGPRPVVTEELARYGRSASVLLTVRPGITGLWQVSGRSDMDYPRRVALDTYYIRHQNLLLDLYILIRTTGVVLSGNGAY